VENISKDFIDEITSWRQHIHQYPETAFEEEQTSEFLAKKLKSFGLEVHRGLAKTGVVAILNKDFIGKSIALRADMDGLDMEEKNINSYSSKNKNKMHACGHDGHMAILLGAAKLLSEDKSFKGKVYFIFQPAEENVAGGKVMIEDGLFKLFDCDEIYGMHNWPGLDVGEFGIKNGAIMASNDIFEIKLFGRGGHAALPHLSNHTILAGSALIQSLNEIISRVVDVQSPAVLSITKFEAGSTYNVLPNEACIWGTVRAFDKEVQNIIEENVRKVLQNISLKYGIKSKIEYKRAYKATINHKTQSDFARTIISKVSEKNAIEVTASMASEDFGFMLDEKPGCLVWLGNGKDSKPLHNENYDFNDKALFYGIKYWIELSKAYF
jgi:hippurate hydrolase